MIISIYLWHSEGFSDRNWNILFAAIDAAKKYGGPFIIAGDFNLAPEQMAAQADFLRKSGVSVRAPNAVTCAGTGGGSEIDFCLIDSRIEHALEKIAVEHSFMASPHQAVILTLRATAPSARKVVLHKPKAFPSRRPITATMPIDEAPAEELHRLLAQVGPPGDAQVDGRFDSKQMEAIDSLYCDLISEGERQLCNLFDHVTPAGESDVAYVGRGLPIKTKSVQVLPPRAQSLGTTGLEARALAVIAAKLKEVGCVIKARQRSKQAGKSPSRKQMQHYQAVVNFLRKPSGDLKRFLDSDAAKLPACNWSNRMALVATLSVDDASAIPTLLRWSSCAASKARTMAGEERSVAQKSWREWVDAQLRVGASALHKLSKRQTLEAPAAIRLEDGSQSMAPHLLMKTEVDKWSPIWLKFADSAQAPWRTFSDWDALTWAAELPELQFNDLRETAKTYKEFTGKGCEGIHPRWIGWMSDKWLKILAAFLMLLERGGYWPGQLEALICLIPKSDGGRRPIGLLPAIIRVWERSRRPVIQAWRATVERSYNWAAKGRSPEDAVWQQALKGEVAKADGLQTASTLVDLVKAFEMVKLELVWRAGLRLHFPPKLLRMVMEIFALARRLVLDQAVSDPILTLSAILAGGTYATDALYMLLLGPCDRILIEYPRLDLCTFVDDLTLSCMGTADFVAQTLPAAFRSLVYILEQELELKVSRSAKRWVLDLSTKTVATASSKTLRLRLSPSFKAEGVPVIKSTKMLGVDFTAGGRLTRRHWRKRVKTVVARKDRYQRMGPTAAKRLVRTGASPALKYGAGIYGANSTEIKMIRSFSCNVQGKMNGRCTFARLNLAKYDPGSEVALKPIYDWARAVWDQWAAKEDMEKAWRMAIPVVATAVRPFSEVIGPAGAFIASSLRVGWRVPSPTAIMTLRGDILDLTTVCPKQLLKHAQRDLSELEAATSSTAARIGGPPDLEPLRDFLSSSSARKVQGSASVRALGEGGWWPQQRLYSEEVRGVTDPFCRACARPATDASSRKSGRAVGTFLHRAVECEASKMTRDMYKDQDILLQAQRHGNPAMCFEVSALFQHGIPLLLPRADPPKMVMRTCGGRLWPEDFTFTGHGFTDGAMRNLAPTAARRAGWACVLVNDAGDIVFGLYGPCDCAFPTALRAELRAVIVMLKHALPPLVLHVDCKTVVDGWAKGRAWCVASCRPDADMWMELWDLLDDIGPGISVRKCKGHASDLDVANGICTAFEKRSNEHADHYAGAGVDIALHQVPNEHLVASYKQARRWYSWLATLAQDLPPDTQVVEKQPRPPTVARLPVNEARHETQPHEIAAEGGLLRCQICALHVSESASASCRRAFLGAPCPGSIASRAVARQATGRPHRLFLSGPVTWCMECDRYSEKRSNALVKQSCGGKPSGGGGREVSLSRLKAGLHPKHPERRLQRAFLIPQVTLSSR